MEEKKIHLSVALAVYNEAENLGKCLESIKEIADEIIVVDGTSSDTTAQIAADHGATVITEPNRTNFHINKQIAIDACRGDWVLQLDADERVSSMLATEIKAIVRADQSTKPDAYYLKRHNYFLGRWMNKGGMYPDPVIRLFKKGRAHLPQANVHELMKVDGVTGWLDNDLLHIADPTFARYLMRSNRYTTLHAEEWLKEGKLGTGWTTMLTYFFFAPLTRFLTIYLRHRGYVDGFPGLVFAVYSGLHLTTSYVKYWEKAKTGAKVEIKKDWN